MKRLVGKFQLDIFHVEQLGILLDQRILGLDQDLDQRFLVEVGKGRDDRQPADEFGDQAELEQIFRLGRFQDFAGLALVGSGDMRAEADRLALEAVGDDLFEAGEGAAADEQDVGRIDLEEFLLRMLAPALRRNAGGGAFHQLQERLLDALAADVAGD